MSWTAHACCGKQSKLCFMVEVGTDLHNATVTGLCYICVTVFSLAVYV